MCNKHISGTDCTPVILVPPIACTPTSGCQTSNQILNQIIALQKYNPAVRLMMNFENAELWSTEWTSGTIRDEFSIKSSGNASLEIIGNYYQQIKCVDICTESIHPVSNKIALDIYIGNNQSNPWWIGQVQLIANCQSAGIYNQHIASVDLTGLPYEVFSTIEFHLPQNIIQVLNSSHIDFSFSITINTNAGSGPYYLDNMRFF